MTNLKEAKRTEELGNGTLYHNLQQKVTEDVNKVQMLGSRGKEKWKCRNNLSIHYWGSRISDGNSGDNPWFLKSQFIFVRRMLAIPCYLGHIEITKEIRKTQCAVCQHDHRIWQCNTFKEEDTNRRWEIAKKHKLCFRCSGSNHFSKACKNSSVCGIDGCTDTHNCSYIKRNQKKQGNQAFTSLMRRSPRWGQLKAVIHEQ